MITEIATSLDSRIAPFALFSAYPPSALALSYQQKKNSITFHVIIIFIFFTNVITIG